MATLYTPDRVERIDVQISVTLAHDRGHEVRTVTFIDKLHGEKVVSQLADLFLSAVDLATACAPRPGEKT